MVDQNKIMEGVKLILEGIGEDVNREGLIDTPKRIAAMYEEVFAGMNMDAAEHLQKTFTADNTDIIGRCVFAGFGSCDVKNFAVLCIVVVNISCLACRNSCVREV